MPLDNGQFDQIQHLSPTERRNPYFVLLDPHLTTRLVALHNDFLLHPVAADGLQAWLEGQIPEIRQLYQDHPATPPLFHVDETLQSLNAQQLPAGERHQIAWNQLQCLKHDPPGNVPPLHPAAPPGPTVDYSVERSDFTGELYPGRVTHYSESARICITPGLEARSRRLGLAHTCAPTARLYKIMALLVSLEVMSFESMHNVDIVETRLYGTYARNVGQLVPRLKKLVLREFDIYSFLFDSFTQLSFHPRLIMSSAHVVVRSLSILRECLSDKIRSQTPLTVQYLYFYRAVRLDIELDRLDDIERELGLDLADPLGSFVAVGTYLEQFVSRYSTGTHGATGVNGPDRYRNIAGAGSGRGCSAANKRKRLQQQGHDVKNRPDYILAAEWPLANGDTVEMRNLLETIGFDVEECLDDSITNMYTSLLPVVKLWFAIESSTDTQTAAELMQDHPVVLTSSTAKQLLDLLESTSADNDLCSKLTQHIRDLEATLTIAASAPTSSPSPALSSSPLPPEPTPSSTPPPADLPPSLPAPQSASTGSEPLISPVPLIGVQSGTSFSAPSPPAHSTPPSTTHSPPSLPARLLPPPPALSSPLKAAPSSTPSPEYARPPPPPRSPTPPPAPSSTPSEVRPSTPSPKRALSPPPAHSPTPPPAGPSPLPAARSSTSSPTRSSTPPPPPPSSTPPPPYSSPSPAPRSSSPAQARSSTPPPAHPSLPSQARSPTPLAAGSLAFNAPPPPRLPPSPASPSRSSASRSSTPTPREATEFSDAALTRERLEVAGQQKGTREGGDEKIEEGSDNVDGSVQRKDREAGVASLLEDRDDRDADPKTPPFFSPAPSPAPSPSEPPLFRRRKKRQRSLRAPALPAHPASRSPSPNLGEATASSSGGFTRTPLWAESDAEQEGWREGPGERSEDDSDEADGSVPRKKRKAAVPSLLDGPDDPAAESEELVSPDNSSAPSPSKPLLSKRQKRSRRKNQRREYKKWSSPEQYVINWPQDHGGGSRLNWKATFVVSHVCRDSLDRLRPLEESTLRDLVRGLVGDRLLVHVLFVEVRTADPFDRFADIQIIFKHEDHHQMFRRDYREGRAGDPGLWQRHNDYWVEKRRREGWW